MHFLPSSGGGGVGGAGSCFGLLTRWGVPGEGRVEYTTSLLVQCVLNFRIITPQSLVRGRDQSVTFSCTYSIPETEGGGSGRGGIVVAVFIDFF